MTALEPRLLVTGATGFLGRHLLDAFKGSHRIFALARGSPESTGAPRGRTIERLQADVSSHDQLRSVEHRIRDSGGLDLAVHLAAYYDFTGKSAPEYRRTNVDGTRNVLEMLNRLGPRHLVFASSVAACDFTSPGRALDEESPANGKTDYAESKRLGEALVRMNRGPFSTSILRLDAVAFFRLLVEKYGSLDDCEVLLASPDGATSHEELYATATACQLGRRNRAVHLPRLACRLGIAALNVTGNLGGNLPFERSWMGECIDQRIEVDSGRTRRRLGWQPKSRLSILRRMPFMVQNRQAHYAEWLKRNHAAAYRTRLRSSGLVHDLLSRHEDEICREFLLYLRQPEQRRRYPAYLGCPPAQLENRHILLLDQLLSAVRAGDKAVFMTCCQHMAERWYGDKTPLNELSDALEDLGRLCIDVIGKDPRSRGLAQDLYDHITMTFQFAIDAVRELAERESERPAVSV